MRVPVSNQSESSFFTNNDEDRCVCVCERGLKGLISNNNNNDKDVDSGHEEPWRINKGEKEAVN